MHTELVRRPAARCLAYFFRGQSIHALLLAAMVPAAAGLANGLCGSSHWLGYSSLTWFWGCIGAAIAHQVYVWLAWRSQLGWQLFSIVFGRYDFLVFRLLFFPLLIVRPLLVLAVAWGDRGSLQLPGWLAFAAGGILLVPALATGHSVLFYFGMNRAAGGDHFREAYRRLPLVNRGVFRWTDNAMYTFAFLGLWSIAFFLQSQLALLAAIFQHGYIWAHYLSTERPDMELLYGDQGEV